MSVPFPKHFSISYVISTYEGAAHYVTIWPQECEANVRLRNVGLTSTRPSHACYVWVWYEIRNYTIVVAI